MKLSLIAIAGFVALLCVPPRAQAQEGSRHARSELEGRRRAALEAIQAGTSTHGELEPLYLELARSAALLGDEEQARRAFTALLALDPRFRLAHEEADEVRSPYLEARGFWSARPVALAVDLTLSPDARAVALHLTDPAKLAARVRVRVRLEGTEDFVELVRLPEADLTVPVDGLERVAGVDVTVALLDEHGNRLIERGSDTLPEHLVVPHLEPAANTQATAPGGSSARPELATRRRRFYAGAALSLVVGAGALSWAVAAHLQREQLAQQWNRGDCDGAGSTRAAVCASQRSDLDRRQTTAAVLYGLGGAAVITGLVLLATAPRKPMRERARSHALACAGGPGRVGVACALRF